MASNLAAKYAQNYAQKHFQEHAAAFEPIDPYYEVVTDERGRTKRRKRDIPVGLTKRDAKALRKIRRRAHHLDKGVKIPCTKARVGYAFFLGLIPGLGDIANAILGYTLIIRPARKLDIPKKVQSQMAFNVAVSTGMQIFPIVGDVAASVWKGNSRNAEILETFLTKRGQDNIAAGMVVEDAGGGGWFSFGSKKPQQYASANYKAPKKGTPKGTPPKGTPRGTPPRGNTPPQASRSASFESARHLQAAIATPGAVHPQQQAYQAGGAPHASRGHTPPQGYPTPREQAAAYAAQQQQQHAQQPQYAQGPSGRY